MLLLAIHGRPRRDIHQQGFVMHRGDHAGGFGKGGKRGRRSSRHHALTCLLVCWTHPPTHHAPACISRSSCPGSHTSAPLKNLNLH